MLMVTEATLFVELVKTVLKEGYIVIVNLTKYYSGTNPSSFISSGLVILKVDGMSNLSFSFQF